MDLENKDIGSESPEISHTQTPTPANRYEAASQDHASHPEEHGQPWLRYHVGQQDQDGKTIQDIHLPRRKILSNPRKMSNNPRASKTEEKRRFKFIIRDSLLKERWK